MAVVAAALMAAGPAAAQAPAATCAPGSIPRGDSCVRTAQAAARVTGIVERTMRAERLKAALVSVRVANRQVTTTARGESMTGVPATTRMRWRIGAVSLSHLGTLALLLAEDGVLDLDEPIARWYPGLRDSGRVTTRMLLDNTSGYRDFVGYAPFNRAFYADVFGTFTEERLIRYALARPSACAPGACWSYSHANSVIAGRVLAKAAGTPLATLLRRRVLGPAGLRDTAIADTAAIPEPALHAFTRERGTYEESTYWNPSWTIARGAVMTATIGDVARTAAVVGSGRLLTPASYAQLTAPTTARFEPWSPRRHYALGVVVDNGWIQQRPSFGGYAGMMLYHPGRRIAIAVATTKLEGAEVDPNFAAGIASRIAGYLAPGAGPENA